MRLFKHCLIIGTWLLIILNPARTHAQSAGLSLSPPVVEILLAPNKQLKQTFNLHVDAENIAVIPNLHLVKPDGVNGHSQIDLSPLNPSSIPLTITSSIPLGIPTPLKPGNPNLSITLTFESASLDVAEDVYLALVVRLAPLGSSTPSLSSNTLPGISALILTTINPTGVMPIGLEIEDFDLPLVHDTWTPLTSSPRLINSVDQMIRPEGKYEIITPSGKSAFSLTLYPNLVLGNSTRLLQGTDPCKNEKGSIPCNPIPLKFTPKWSDIGPHRVKLTITTQGGTTITQVERVVWFLPIRISVVVIITILLAVALTINQRRRSKKPLMDA